MKHYGAVEDPKDLTTKEYVDTTANPFQITFETLEGVTVTTGVWNESYARLEC